MIKKWIKKSWQDPVWSKVFASAIIGILTLLISVSWILIQTLFNQISLHNSFLEFLRLIELRISVPVWFILVFLTIILLLILIRYLKGKRVAQNLPEAELLETKSLFSNSGIYTSTNIGLAKPGYNSTLNGEILGSNSGIFSIWGYVADIHNRIHPRRRNMYIVSHASNNGNPSKDPTSARYHNAWAILRVVPTAIESKGVWRFWCNNISKELTHLDYNNSLSFGWHLFSVAWSSEDNYIKFAIDKKVVAEENFSNWPTDFSSSIIIGTWPNRADIHYYDSKIGPYKFIESKYREDLIRDYFSKKPV